VGPLSLQLLQALAPALAHAETVDFASEAFLKHDADMKNILPIFAYQFFAGLGLWTQRLRLYLALSI
jgi:hypothetical protein